MLAVSGYISVVFQSTTQVPEGMQYIDTATVSHTYNRRNKSATGVTRKSEAGLHIMVHDTRRTWDMQAMLRNYNTSDALSASIERWHK